MKRRILYLLAVLGLMALGYGSLYWVKYWLLHSLPYTEGVFLDRSFVDERSFLVPFCMGILLTWAIITTFRKEDKNFLTGFCLGVLTLVLLVVILGVRG